MQLLQFRDFVFPSNPASIQLHQQQRLVAHVCPGYGEIHQSLGAMADRVICQGVFWSESAQQTSQQIDTFLAVAGNKERGLLFLPFGPPQMAFLEQLVVDGQGDGRIVPYTLVFVAADAYA